MDTAQLATLTAVWSVALGAVFGTPYIPAPRGHVPGRWGDDYIHHADRHSLAGMHGGPVDMRASDGWWAAHLDRIGGRP